MDPKLAIRPDLVPVVELFYPSDSEVFATYSESDDIWNKWIKMQQVVKYVQKHNCKPSNARWARRFVYRQ